MLVFRILKYFSRKKLAGLVAAISLCSGLEAIGVVSLVPLLEMAQKGGESKQRVITFGLALLALYLVKGWVTIWVGWIQEKFWRTSDAELGHRLLSHYLRLPYERFLATNTAHFYRTITFDTSQVTGGVNFFLSLLSEVLLIGFIMAGLFYLDPKTTLVVAVGVPVVFGGIYLLVQKKVNALAMTTQDLSGKQILAANQALQGVKEIQVFGGEAFFASAYLKNAMHSANVLTRLQVLGLIPKNLIEVLVMTVGVGAILYVVLESENPSHALSIIALYAMAGYKIMPSLNRLVTAAINLKRTLPSMAVVDSELNGIRGSSSSDAVPGHTPGHVYELRDRLTLKDVSFSYAGTSPVLDRVSIEFKRGSFVGVVGTSGAGKSTLVDLILGLLKPSSGTLAIDGREVQTSDSRYRSLFGYVPQTIYLTDDTLARNIAFAKEDSEIDMDRVRQAAEAAQLLPWISSLEKGFDTVVGERGTRVSGGQKQRLGIARALYRNPKVLILDEATSALDGITESEFLETLESLRGTRTIVLVAHRISTLVDCDEVVFLKHGRIDAKGRHEELYVSSPDYQQLCHSLNIHG